MNKKAKKQTKERYSDKQRERQAEKKGTGTDTQKEIQLGKDTEVRKETG
jgi:hypothetical protein